MAVVAGHAVVCVGGGPGLRLVQQRESAHLRCLKVPGCDRGSMLVLLGQQIRLEVGELHFERQLLGLFGQAVGHLLPQRLDPLHPDGLVGPW